MGSAGFLTARSENPRVVGSIPTLATISFNYLEAPLMRPFIDVGSVGSFGLRAKRIQCAKAHSVNVSQIDLMLATNHPLFSQARGERSSIRDLSPISRPSECDIE
jgi:hypothetical protein